MARSTIDFGIDLGTTNSAIAVLNGVKADVVKSNLDTDITPSAVYIGKNGNVIVGSKAKSKMEDDRSAEDAYIEFKRRMGGDSPYVFKSSGLTKIPEELSAEVLKSLKGNVQQRLDEDIRAAVITIPAAFASRQCVATKKAAELAGLVQCPLLQEPVAASLAYGFQANTDKKSFWLVFDFGGGTFDAAVMKAEDGDIQVVNHGGDNFLGGSDIDWGIIEKIVIPQIKGSYNLPDFKRGNAQWRSAFAKIKRAVEEAKIGLSRTSEAFLDGCVFEDADGNEVELDGFKLTQDQVSDIAEPLIERAVEKCRAVLAEKNLQPSMIEKTILVGGPTLAPYFRDILSTKLGIPLDHSVDPLTVVAQGAAVFAGTQRLDRATRAAAPVAAGAYKVSLNYQPIGPDDDPSVTGEVTPPAGGTTAGCTIEFVNRVTRWSSGALPLNGEGKFHLRLRAEPGSQNIFDINLVDASGTKLPTDTTEIPYTIGVCVKAQITCNDISIELADNKVETLVPKGTSYPFKKTNRKFTTVVELKKGQPGKIVIPVLEARGGDAGRLADHNLRLGDLVLTSDGLRRDLPLGSEIEITLSAKEPGAIKAEAYVPLLDETFSTRIEYDRKASASESDLKAEFQKEKARAKGVIQRANADGSETAQKINAIFSDIDSRWDSAGSVEGAKQIEARIIEARVMLDDLEESAKFPEKVKEIEEMFEDIASCDSEMTSAQRSELRELKSKLAQIEGRKSISEIEQLKSNEVLPLWREVFVDRFDFWAGSLAYLYKTRNRLPQTTEVNRLFEQGARGMDSRDKETVRRCVLRLWDLSPQDVVEEAKRGHGSGITL